MKYINTFNEGLFSFSFDKKWVADIAKQLNFTNNIGEFSSSPVIDNDEVYIDIICTRYNEELKYDGKFTENQFKMRINLEKIKSSIIFTISDIYFFYKSTYSVQTEGYHYKKTIEAKKNDYKKTFNIDFFKNHINIICEKLNKLKSEKDQEESNKIKANKDRLAISKENAKNQVNNFNKHISLDDIEDLFCELDDMLDRRDIICIDFHFMINYSTNLIRGEVSDLYINVMRKLNDINHKLKSLYDTKLWFELQNNELCITTKTNGFNREYDFNYEDEKDGYHDFITHHDPDGFGI